VPKNIIGLSFRTSLFRSCQHFYIELWIGPGFKSIIHANIMATITTHVQSGSEYQSTRRNSSRLRSASVYGSVFDVCLYEILTIMVKLPGLLLVFAPAGA